MTDSTSRPSQRRRAPRRSERSLRTEAAFRTRLVELGATLLETEYLGADKAHRLRCANGHACSPRPASIVSTGRGICSKCPGASSRRSETTFRTWIAQLGATLLDEEWRGSNTYYRAICPEGHECTYSPNQVSRGRAGCQTCGKAKPGVVRSNRAEAAFRARLQELGVTLLNAAYLGSMQSHPAVCVHGHDCSPRPADIARGAGPCRVCAKLDPAAADQAFRLRVAELGATLLEPRWLGNKTPHRVICAEGHECSPLPNNALRFGICARCRGRDSNAFYVLTDEDEAVLKLGITGGDGRQRLRCHALNGFTTVHRFLTDLPEGVAPELERHALATLRLAGERPVQGREYFPASALAVVFDVVDNYPISKPSNTWKATA